MLLNAGLQFRPPDEPLHWQRRDFTEEEKREVYRPGVPWGPGWVRLHLSLRETLTPETAGRVGAMLLAENQRSVDHLYDEEEWETPYLFQHLSWRPDPVAVLRAIAGYRVQASEHPEWPDSEATRFCAALQTTAISSLPRFHVLPNLIETEQDLLRCRLGKGPNQE